MLNPILHNEFSYIQEVAVITKDDIKSFNTITGMILDGFMGSKFGSKGVFFGSLVGGLIGSDL